jgi:hypothetical protein
MSRRAASPRHITSIKRIFQMPMLSMSPTFAAARAIACTCVDTVGFPPSGKNVQAQRAGKGTSSPRSVLIVRALSPSAGDGSGSMLEGTLERDRIILHN